MHIGLIGGIGPAATEFYYNRMAKAHDDAGAEMDVTIVHASVRELLANVLADARQAQAEVFCRYVQRLKDAGAEAAAVTSLGGHFCIKELEAISPLISSAIMVMSRVTAMWTLQTPSSSSLLFLFLTAPPLLTCRRGT